MLAGIRAKGIEAGIRQFIVQTHFESPMEVTPEAKQAIDRLLGAGWIVTNQHVFTAASSRRGHTAKLRKVLNDTGVVNYYTFSVKGYRENTFNFATNERAVQEQTEEKVFGLIPEKEQGRLLYNGQEPAELISTIDEIRRKHDLPFAATDRNVLNLPGIGKSLIFRTIGITRYGRRILSFDLDHTRNHSPALKAKERVIIIESKSVSEYLQQLSDIGEDTTEDYELIWGFSLGETEPRFPLFEYPGYEYAVTDRFTNITSLPDAP
ncbi:MAG: hypothetical protein Kow00127_08150 [Bacteroidales bacterium]